MQIVRTATGILKSHRQTITIKRPQPINTRRSQVNGKNKIQPINTYPLLLVRYSAGIIGWPKEEIKASDIKTKKLIAIDRGFQLKSSPPDYMLRSMSTSETWPQLITCLVNTSGSRSLRKKRNNHGMTVWWSTNRQKKWLV